MFSAMIAWIFWHKGPDMLSRLVTALMVVMALGFVKDALVQPDLADVNSLTLELSTVADVVAVPIYAFILYELCCPGRLTARTIFVAEAPFVLLPILLGIFRWPGFYYIDMSLAVVLGLVMATWTYFAIPRYHAYLKATFSYDDDISLKWLQSILWAFFVILLIWALSCVYYDPWLNIAYMGLTLMLWIFICYFIYRHKSVVDELRPLVRAAGGKPSDSGTRAEVFARIRHLIEVERIYLNPLLKLLDIAGMANTNRTYASAYFRLEAGMTFYDFINGLRVEHASMLLADTSRRLEEVAEESGFNSRQSFHRTFAAMKGMTPADYRSMVHSSVSQD